MIFFENIDMATGCKTWKSKTCPKYMYNYIKGSDSHDAIVNGDETSYDYWTMNSSADSNTHVWFVHPEGSIYRMMVGIDAYGVRPVIEVNK